MYYTIGYLQERARTDRHHRAEVEVGPNNTVIRCKHWWGVYKWDVDHMPITETQAKQILTQLQQQQQ
ncbi:hypothetical protein [Paraburkholderia sp. C35]|uniref:hypothetical protein n=1 Tax=Paraburkholderia sp. C35 TaxID=2126993 RepID=UPI000D687618|nr:hypothetical protein [Paraburkholderia sp. C35]